MACQIAQKFEIERQWTVLAKTMAATKPTTGRQAMAEPEMLIHQVVVQLLHVGSTIYKYTVMVTRFITL